MADQSFEQILDGVAARHEDKGWRSAVGRASSGLMALVGMRRGPKIAGTAAGSEAARAAYEEDLEAEDFSDFDEPAAPRSAPSPSGPRAASAPPQRPAGAEAASGGPKKPESRGSGETPRRAEPPRSDTPRDSRRGFATDVEAAYGKSAAAEEAPPPAGAPSTDPRDVAKELNILTASSVKDLLDARRSFARANHPDRVAILYRPQATVRMQIANRLVDDAIARMSGQGRR
ncbi:hypothetical protein [Jiella sonneratiae]|uniref:J domain-containing protein n=1 Tax=Jiella sonneratiae TaxID=2816856 RepID=A0ABS3J0B2_9HYPH|nr:hypothetical protein [Jiella sonneratiae]MBO0903119.1 hypothetical protein [Jiella sonneratiae]